MDRATPQDLYLPSHLSKHENKDNTQATHQAKQAHITSSVLHVLLQQWWSSYGKIMDDERPKSKGVRNNSSKEAIKEEIQ
jgi:hypothetical protein